MFKRPILFALGLALSSVALPAAAQEATASTVVATVNGTDITLGHMIILREALPEQYRSIADDRLFDGILDQLIRQTVLADTIEKPSQAIALQLENEQRALLAGAAMATALVDVTSDEALQAAYDKKYADAEPSKEYNASHILVETENEAIDLIAKLTDGAIFADLAKDFSTGPSGPNGGELGWFGEGMMVQPFQEAVFAMQVGGVSAPVQTQFGWHVIALNETRLLEGPSFEDVRAELSEEIQQEALEGILTKLTDAADVVRPDISGIDRATIQDRSLVEN